MQHYFRYHVVFSHCIFLWLALSHCRILSQQVLLRASLNCHFSIHHVQNISALKVRGFEIDVDTM